MLLSKVTSAIHPPNTRMLAAISTELAMVEQSCAGVCAGVPFAERMDIFFTGGRRAGPAGRA
jgi:hypothetical protein